MFSMAYNYMLLFIFVSSSSQNLNNDRSLQLARTNRASLLGLEKGPEAHGLLSTEQNEHSLIQEGGD